MVVQVQYPPEYNPNVGWSSVPHTGLFDSEDFTSFRGDSGVPIALLEAFYNVMQVGAGSGRGSERGGVPPPPASPSRSALPALRCAGSAPYVISAACACGSRLSMCRV